MSPELICVCAGRADELDIHGEKVRTAYLKSEVPGPAVVTENGVEGNEVAVHTDAIYIFSKEHYNYWADAIGADVQKWKHGFFAETFLLSALNEHEFCVGDIYSLGSEVRLIVAGPRIPCFKLCWRLEQPDTFIREFALSGKTGVYFNVVSTGSVEAGDKLKLVEKANDRVGINDIAAYAFGAKTVSIDELEKVLALPGLSEISALVLRNKLYFLEDQARLKVGRWTGWREFEVVKVDAETVDIKSFLLQPADDEPIAQYRAGQFLTVQLNAGPEGSQAIRVWSLSDYEDQPGRYRLSIKKEPEGLCSTFMHDRIAVGSRLMLKPPMGRFVLDRGSFKPIILIAGGIGITPLLSMLKAHLMRGETCPPIFLIHCVRNRASQPFRSELDELEEHPQVKVLHIYDSPSDEDFEGIDYQASGYLTLEHIVSLTAGCHIEFGGKSIDMPWFESDIYLCGPPAFQEMLVPILIDNGANADRVYTESFSATSGQSTSRVLNSATVHLAKSEKVLRWLGEENMTLLELIESAGVTPGNSCRMGVCMSCSVALQEGEVYYEYQLTHSPEPDQVLLCSARPASETIVLDI